LPGYDISISKSIAGITASWLIASPATAPNPAKIRWSLVQNAPQSNVVTPENYGAPGKYLNTDGTATAFNCAQRLCVLDQSRKVPTISLVSAEQNDEGVSSAWIVIDRVRYLVAGVNGQLSMFRP